MNNYRVKILLMGLFLIFTACKKDKVEEETNTTSPGDPTPFQLNIPKGFPSMDIPEDNPMTVEGVQLGRKLFYDPILSGDNTMSCGTCHAPAFAFFFSSGVVCFICTFCKPGGPA